MKLEDLIPASAVPSDDGQFPAFRDAASEMRAAHEATVLVPLTHLSRLRADGEDAATFLHNLLTNDVKGLPADGLRLGGFCTAKGRLLAAFTYWRDGDATVLQLPRALAEAMRRKLSMYILRAKATLTDTSDAMPALGLAGSGAEAALQAAGLPVPPGVMTRQAVDGTSVLRLAADRFELVVPPERLDAVWTALAAHATPAGSPAWRRFDIRDGLVSIWPATQEAFVPQMVNFELTGGVSFKKGCYPGQEIVARTQYLGKLKRRMYRASADCPPPPAGTAVYGSDTQDQACGAVVDAVARPDGGCELLAVVQMSSTEAGPVRVGATDGPALTLLDLPYPLGSAEE